MNLHIYVFALTILILLIKFINPLRHLLHLNIAAETSNFTFIIYHCRVVCNNYRQVGMIQVNSPF